MIPGAQPIRIAATTVALMCVGLHLDAQATPLVHPSVGIRFARGHRTPPIPFELIGNHVYVRAQVNGSQPLWFLLDTGATRSYMDLEQSRSLRLETGADSAALDLPGSTSLISR